MGAMERFKAFTRFVGWKALITEQGWQPAQLHHGVELKRIPDHPFSIQQPNGLLHGEPGDYLLRDPVSGYTTVLPAVIAQALFIDDSVAGLTVPTQTAASAAEQAATT